MGEMVSRKLQFKPVHETHRAHHLGIFQILFLITRGLDSNFTAKAQVPSVLFWFTVIFSRFERHWTLEQALNMTQFLPPNLLALFAPRELIPYFPPLDQLPWEKKPWPYSGISQYLNLFEVSVSNLFEVFSSLLL